MKPSLSLTTDIIKTFVLIILMETNKSSHFLFLVDFQIILFAIFFLMKKQVLKPT